MDTRTDLTFSYIKPENGMSNKEKIIEKIKINKFEILAKKKHRFSREDAEWLYEEKKGLDFYETLIDFTISQEVTLLILVKKNAVVEWRKSIGNTKNPEEGTIRKMFEIPNPGHKNVVHGSDSDERAKEEILKFFPKYKFLFYW